MTLPPGTRLGSYEILAQLGAGGMGEFYRANDLRIDRMVALKVLPEATVLSEAWLLAALEDLDGAFDLLRLACEERQLLIPFTGLPGFDPLRGDPRFAALQERLGMTHS